MGVGGCVGLRNVNRKDNKQNQQKKDYVFEGDSWSEVVADLERSVGVGVLTRALEAAVTMLTAVVAEDAVAEEVEAVAAVLN